MQKTFASSAKGGPEKKRGRLRSTAQCVTLTTLSRLSSLPSTTTETAIPQVPSAETSWEQFMATKPSNAGVFSVRGERSWTRHWNFPTSSSPLPTTSSPAASSANVPPLTHLKRFSGMNVIAKCNPQASGRPWMKNTIFYAS